MAVVLSPPWMRTTVTGCWWHRVIVCGCQNCGLCNSLCHPFWFWPVFAPLYCIWAGRRGIWELSLLLVSSLCNALGPIFFAELCHVTFASCKARKWFLLHLWQSQVSVNKEGRKSRTSTCYVPGFVLSVLHVVIHFSLITVLQCGHSFFCFGKWRLQ